MSVTKTKDVFKDKGTSLPPASQSTCPCRHGQCCALPTWWSWRGGCTRSHSEHGRETPQRRWYFVSRRGRVGRCQVCKAQLISSHLQPQNTGPLSAALFAFRHETIPSWPVAGWSSPVARQAHNLKVAGSNPAPATKQKRPNLNRLWAFLFARCPAQNHQGSTYGKQMKTSSCKLGKGRRALLPVLCSNSPGERGFLSEYSEILVHDKKSGAFSQRSTWFGPAALKSPRALPAGLPCRSRAERQQRAGGNF